MTKAFYSISEKLYKDAAAQGAAQQGDAGAGAGPDETSSTRTIHKLIKVFEISSVARTPTKEYLIIN